MKPKHSSYWFTVFIKKEKFIIFVLMNPCKPRYDVVLYLRRMLDIKFPHFRVGFIMKPTSEIGVEGFLYDVYFTNFQVLYLALSMWVWMLFLILFCRRRHCYCLCCEARLWWFSWAPCWWWEQLVSTKHCASVQTVHNAAAAAAYNKSITTNHHVLSSAFDYPQICIMKKNKHK